MYGYSGIHYLRRIAVHVAGGADLPVPGDTHATDDSAVRRYYSHPISTQRFPHLMWHSDCEGFYVPVAFDDVIIAGSEYGVRGDFIGSAAALLEECATLAQMLQIPPDLDGESEEVENAADYQGQGTQRWERYGIETYNCLRLMKACKLSLATGCALVFT